MKHHADQRPHAAGCPDDFRITDGSGISEFDGYYAAENYLRFLSNGMADNEKIDAVDYYDAFLDENILTDDQ